MPPTVCLIPKHTLYYPQGSGLFWAFLNWALGLKALGCRLIWLEQINNKLPIDQLGRLVETLRFNLERHGLGASLALYDARDPVPDSLSGKYLTIDDAASADLLINICYSTPPDVVRRFRQSALLDIDPGLLQTWVDRKQIRIDHHDHYFTIGETVGRPESKFPNLGLEWHYTPPAVALDHWPVTPSPPGAAFTTVVHWHAGAWIEGDNRPNDKREAFLPYVTLPRHFPGRLELGLYPDIDPKDRELLLSHGWHIANTLETAATPWNYQEYIRRSCGEFSCAKPAYVDLQTAWVSDRTICYLASGKPAVVQHTGPSRFLSGKEGLLQFKNLEEAARCLELVQTDYERHSAAARRLAEDYFDARKNAQRLLEKAIA